MGKKKKFQEGQVEQVLDDLFFHYIQTAKKLQPKIVVAENVKGLIMGKARGYVKQIFQMFDDAGYDTQLFLLNSAFMGVPQRRERTFFISRRKDLKLNKLELKFNEDIITVSAAIEGAGGEIRILSEAFAKWWRKTIPGKSFASAHPKGSFFNSVKLHPDKPSPTMTASEVATLTHWNEPKKLSGLEMARLQTFPGDYNYNDKDPRYICGMSVPPYMMQRISIEIAKVLIKK